MRVNIVEISCRHVWNGNVRHAETILKMEVRGIKENDGESEFKYDIL
jgi:hypothetical protein